MNILKVKVNGILVGYEYITSNLKYDILGNTKAVVYLTLSQNFYDDNDIDYINDISYRSNEISGPSVVRFLCPRGS